MIRLKTAAIMASIMVTTTVTACAGDLSHITQTKIRLP